MSRPSGFTLIEVVLAIALSAVLLVLLSMAIGLYLFRVDASRSAVENGQIARGVLRLIADDLRGAATVYEQDTSAVDELAAAQASFNVDELDEASDSSDETEAQDTRPALGLFGGPAELRLDVHKQRAIDPVIEFGSGETQTPPATLLGTTTVRYLMAEGGLVRQEASRDVNLWESAEGLGETLVASSRVIAPEATQLRFLYSDGEQTTDQWDSEQQEGALPAAIELRLTLRQPTNASSDDGDEPRSINGAPSDGYRFRTYRMVLAMPSANPSDEESDSQDSESI